KDSSLDANVILDFWLTGTTNLLIAAMPKGGLVSDFVEAELKTSNVALPLGCEMVCLTTEDELNFFANLRRRYGRLGAGELGAITVAHFRSAILVSNDRLARAAATELGIEVSGGLGVLRSAVAAG